MGRGELEQMLDALVHPRAEHIAEVNGKGGNAAHIQVVKRDIRARVLKQVKVAPTYHVKIEDAGHGRKRVQIQAKGDEAYARAIIPERKSQGNVDVTKFRRGGPGEAEVVNKAQFDATGGVAADVRTERIHGQLAGALPSGLSVEAKANLGLTAVAKRAAAKKREGQQAPNTRPGDKTDVLRRIEAAVAGKGIRKAQGDRLRAILTRNGPIGGEDDALTYWERVAKQQRIRRAPKADRDAVAAMIAHLEGGQAPGDIRRHIDPDVERLLIHAQGHQREKLRALFAAHERRRGESVLDYVRRVRQVERVQLRNDPELMVALRAVRREAPHAEPVGGGALLGRLQNLHAAENKHALSGRSLPGGSEWLGGQITDMIEVGGGINSTWRGKIDGRTVFFKPQSGAHGGNVHGGIPPGHDAERERGAWLVGEAMGLQDNLAPTIVRNVPGHGLCIVQGGVGKNPAKDVGLPFGPVAQQDKRTLALFDAVIGNLDRHQGNMMVDPNKGRIYGIDNGFAFAEGPNERGGWNNGFLNDFWGQSLTGDELDKLKTLLVDARTWDALQRDAGLPGDAVVRARRRVKWMIRERKFLRNATQMGGNPERLDNIA